MRCCGQLAFLALVHCPLQYLLFSTLDFALHPSARLQYLAGICVWDVMCSAEAAGMISNYAV